MMQIQKSNEYKARLVHRYSSTSQQVNYLLFQPEKSFLFQEGQFCMLQELQQKGRKKPYSIATTNCLLQEEKLIGFVVKKASDEGMSYYLTQEIQIDDEILLKGPLGHYVDPKNHQNYLFVSVGSGLSPNLGLFTYLAQERNHKGKMVHIFGERSREELIPEVQTILQMSEKDNIRSRIHLSQDWGADTIYRRGYVQSSLAEAVAFLGCETTCFVCGSPSVVADIVAQLQQLGIAREDVIVEKW